MQMNCPHRPRFRFRMKGIEIRMQQHSDPIAIALTPVGFPNPRCGKMFLLQWRMLHEFDVGTRGNDLGAKVLVPEPMAIDAVAAESVMVESPIANDWDPCAWVDAPNANELVPKV